MSGAGGRAGGDLLSGLPLVDGHHHFWQIGRFPYRWLAADAPPARFGDKTSISGDYLPAQYLAAFDGLPLRASVHVQANCGAADPAAETRWLQRLSEDFGWPTAIVAEADLSDSGAPALIARHLTCPALRGIRTPVAWDDAGRWRVGARPGLLSDPVFRRSLDTFEENALCLDLVVVPEQLAEVRALARDRPGLSIVLDHFAHLEPARPGNAEDWRAGIAGLASCPNVAVKLSGLWTADRDWTPAVLRPFVDHALAMLGPARLLYGSNMPVEGVNCPVERQMAALTDLLESLPRPDLGAIFAGTAARVFRLPVPSAHTLG